MYAVGGPLGGGTASLLRLLTLLAAYFAAVAWLNVRAITHWESGGLAAKGPPLRQNGLRLGRIAWGLAALGLLLAAWLLPMQPRSAAVVAAGAASAVLIGWLDWRRQDFSPLALRVAVDVALLTPLLLAAAPLLQ